MARTNNISADGVQVEVRYGGVEGDFISLTDIANIALLKIQAM